jgi:anti-anti-sigma regulatory factor
LELPSSGDFTAMSELKETLLERLAAGQSVHLDGSLVEEPSTTLIQVIEAAAVSFAGRDLQFGLISPSEALCSAYEDLGLFGALMSRIVADA